MSYDDLKMFKSFIRLGASKFSGAIGEDTYEFLVDCQEKLHNVRSLKSHGVTYKTYQLINMSRIGGGHMKIIEV